jgi:hypothetical protein
VALLVVGAAVALIILHTCEELHRRVLGKVVGQALPIQAEAEAVFPYQCPVVVYGFQMSPEMQSRSPRCFKSLTAVYHSTLKKTRKI